MKRISIISIVAFGIIIFLGAFTFNFNSKELNTTANTQDELNLDFPDDVKKILKTSCFDCHTAASKNIKAKGALNFNKWNDYKTTKKIGKLNDLCELVQDGDMPTSKYLKNYPDKKLNEEQVKLICDWTKKETNSLME